jgi:hypothetical protein
MQVLTTAPSLPHRYEFKSTSMNRELMSQPKFCGHEPGPRTHFVIEATRAYSIVEFSSFGEEEAEVLSDDPLMTSDDL